MHSIPFVFLGEPSTYWNLYYGWGLLVAVLTLTLAIILWTTSALARRDQRTAGAICAIIAVDSLASAYISFSYFYVPPSIVYSVVSVILSVATVQLLRPGKTL